jgi:putative flavoprotein involved in K+ transport
MAAETVEVLVVGAGQAGIAISEHLRNAGIPHLVLEKDRIAEKWRTGRWDSLVANGPAWHDRFPNLEFTGVHPDAFAAKDRVADYFDEYASKLAGEIRTGVEVTSVRRNEGRPGFRAETSAGPIEADFVVAATGPFQVPVFPPLVPASAGLEQLHSSAYRNPEQLPEGAVLVVGAGSSGMQIADELLRSGRKVYLSVGPHDRPPRAYRQRDFCWWLGVLGKWDMETPPGGSEHVTIVVSGANGGETVDFRDLAQRGMVLLGRTLAYDNGVLRLAPDLGVNIAKGDANYLSLLNEADAYVVRNGLDLPEEQEAHELGPLPDLANEPVLELNLAEAGVTTIIWATGFRVDYRWLEVDAFDETGRPQHKRGISTEPGVYFLGLPWLSRRGSSFIWGVWHDAKHIADHIGTQRKYVAYRSDAG